MKKKVVYQKIEEVIRSAGRPIAAHEFCDVVIAMPVDHIEGGRIVDGRYYVGQSESAIARRLREMRELGRVTSSTRQGTAFKEYKLAVRAFVQQHFAFEAQS